MFIKALCSITHSRLWANTCAASYLGIDVAIKEVLPSDSYNVAKYFEREWRLMK
jgi:LIM domain kinase 1